jgi:hypothetical protein
MLCRHPSHSMIGPMVAVDVGTYHASLFDSGPAPPRAVAAVNDGSDPGGKHSSCSTVNTEMPFGVVRCTKGLPESLPIWIPPSDGHFSPKLFRGISNATQPDCSPRRRHQGCLTIGPNGTATSDRFARACAASSLAIELRSQNMSMETRQVRRHQFSDASRPTPWISPGAVSRSNHEQHTPSPAAAMLSVPR